MSVAQREKQAIERLVTLQVQRLLGPGGPQARYEGTESPHDISLVAPDGGVIGVAEITRDCDADYEAYLDSMIKHRNHVPLPPGWGSWAVTLERARSLREFGEEMVQLIGMARNQGRDEYSLDLDWPALDVHTEMRNTGVGHLARVPGDDDRCLFIGPFHGGQIDARPELLNEYIEDALTQPSVIKRLTKLTAASVDVRELVLLPDRPQDHFSLSYRMNGWSQWPGTPSDDPATPTGLTGLWIVQPRVGHVVAWRRDFGWLHGPPQGADWWREFQDVPELQVLFEELGSSVA